MLMAAAPVAEGEAVPGEEWAEAESAADTDPTVNDYPMEPVLGAFATACSGIEIVSVAQASVSAAGWERFEPAADSAIGQIVSSGTRLLAEMDPDDQPEVIDGGIWRQQIAGRELFIVISGVKDSGVGSYGCRLYDLAAPRAPTAEQLQDWAVREPQQVFTGIPGAYKFTWNPGLKPGHMEMEASFVQQGTVLPAPLTGIPLSGIVLTASALEFLDQ